MTLEELRQSPELVQALLDGKKIFVCDSHGPFISRSGRCEMGELQVKLQFTTAPYDSHMSNMHEVQVTPCNDSVMDVTSLSANQQNVVADYLDFCMVPGNPRPEFQVFRENAGRYWA